MSNLINGQSILSDSYKYTHHNQYPSDMTAMYTYMESRGGMYSATMFFGMSAYLKKYLLNPITMDDVEFMNHLIDTHIPGSKFDKDGWKRIVTRHGGYIPVRIRAVPEGTIVPNHNVLVTVESTDPQVPWVASHIETSLLRLWYPSTVATRSNYIRSILKTALEETSDLTGSDFDGKLNFMLHDFGMRGASSQESAGISGAAHLINFMGTDNLDALLWMKKYYGGDIAGYSIPASEHSVMTSYGREHEIDAYRNMIKQFGQNGNIFANVVDSYNIYNVATYILPQLKDELTASGATMVVRPDSGDPNDVLPRIMNILDHVFGSTINSKGYKVLNKCVRVIWGDGINESSIIGIINVLKKHHFSVENIAFGCGGYLLQGLTRDTQKMAIKTSAVCRNGIWMETVKDPITDHGKKSKGGKVTLYQNGAGDFYTSIVTGEPDAMRTAYENGDMDFESFLDIRDRARKAV